MTTVTSEQYDALCEIIDRAKNDDESQDTDVYAGAALAVLGLAEPVDNDDSIERAEYNAHPETRE